MAIKYLPNLLSILRLLLAPVLILLLPTTPWFVAAYLLIGATDLADGFIARKYKLESPLGARLDSLGDLALYLTLLYISYRMFALLFMANLLFLLCIIALRLANMLFTAIKYKQVLFYHTLANKITGLLAFLLPLLLISTPRQGVIRFVLAVATLASLEESAIILTEKVPHLNRRSLFWE